MSTYFHTKLFGLLNFLVTPRRVMNFYLVKIFRVAFLLAQYFFGA